jgi:hypothetical protein
VTARNAAQFGGTLTVALAPSELSCRQGQEKMVEGNGCEDSNVHYHIQGHITQVAQNDQTDSNEDSNGCEDSPTPLSEDSKIGFKTMSPRLIQMTIQMKIQMVVKIYQPFM